MFGDLILALLGMGVVAVAFLGVWRLFVAVRYANEMDRLKLEQRKTGRL